MYQLYSPAMMHQCYFFHRQLHSGCVRLPSNTSRTVFFDVVSLQLLRSSCFVNRKTERMSPSIRTCTTTAVTPSFSFSNSSEVGAPRAPALHRSAVEWRRKSSWGGVGVRNIRNAVFSSYGTVLGTAISPCSLGCAARGIMTTTSARAEGITPAAESPTTQNYRLEHDATDPQEPQREHEVKGSPSTLAAPASAQWPLATASQCTPPHSLLRHLIPLRVQGEGPASVLVHHAMLRWEHVFLPAFLSTLAQAPTGIPPPRSEDAPEEEAHRLWRLLEEAYPSLAAAKRLAGFPMTPRLLLAEAMQWVLEGTRPQRELREAFEQAELACRRALLDLEDIPSSYFVLPPPPPPAPSTSPQRYRRAQRQHEEAERLAWRMVSVCPLYRLWMYELRAAAAYYRALFSIPSCGGTPATHVASTTVYSIMAADVRRDVLLTEALLTWEKEAVKHQAEVEEADDVLQRRHAVSVLHRWTYRIRTLLAQRRQQRQRRNASSPSHAEVPARRQQYFQAWLDLKKGLYPYAREMEPSCLRSCTPEGAAGKSVSSPSAVDARSPRTDSPRCTDDAKDSGVLPPLQWSWGEPTSFPSPCSPHAPSLVYGYGHPYVSSRTTVRETAIPMTASLYPERAEPHSFSAGSSADGPSCETGTSAASFPSLHDLFVQELLLVERDCFGVFRADPRGDHRHLMHIFQLQEMGKTWESFALLFHPVMRLSGHFEVRFHPIANHRWWSFGIRCKEEDHRLVPRQPPSAEGGAADAAQEFPLFEEVRLASTTPKERPPSRKPPMPAMSSAEPHDGLRFTVYYNEPICFLRHGATERERKGRCVHTETFELAVVVPHDEEEVRWFSLNRWFRERV